MQRIFLIRHGHPDFPPGTHMCLGRTDTPLGPPGRMQAFLLGRELREEPLTVFTSPLRRCRETAAFLSGDAHSAAGLAEQDMGPWDGLEFSVIKTQWPELYARRAEEPLLVPSGAETLLQVRERVLPAFTEILKNRKEDIAIVAHASVIQVILAEIKGISLEKSRPLRIPYGAFAVLQYDRTLSVAQEAALPRPALTPALAEGLLSAAAPGENIEAHCRAVAREAARIADSLPFALDKDLLVSAALLHDAARREKDHAAAGAQWLNMLGFSAAAAIVEKHHDFTGTSIDETAVLYIADKCIKEDRRVPIEERFAASESRCRTKEARTAWRARREEALRLKDEINGICGKTLIE